MGMQKRLLTKPDLNIARALELARGIEAAASETKGFKNLSSIAGTPGKVLNLEGATAAIVPLSRSSPSGGFCCHSCGAITTRDGHASTGKPSVAFMVKLVISHLSVKEVQQRKRLILEVERIAGKQMW